MTVSAAPRVIVAGDGVIGLTIALHLSARSVAVTLLAPSFHGAASAASAGMLAPSVDRTQGAAQAFSDAARSAWPRLADLVERSGGGAFALQRDGILQIARTETTASALRARAAGSDQWMTPEDARQLVPELGDLEGAALHPGDGVVDAPAALTALRRALGSSRHVRLDASPLIALRPTGGRVVCTLKDSRQIECDVVVLAAGAWAGSIGGLPRPLPIKPLRGAMIGVDAPLVRIPIYEAGGHAYVFPRGQRTLIGATSDDVGFVPAPAETDAARLLARGANIIPAIGRHAVAGPWAGLRPITPDGLAVIGADPAEPKVLYAVGHGRNGFLQAALTGEAIAAIVLGEPLTIDIGPFNPARFDVTH